LDHPLLVSVIVPTYNREQVLCDTLAYLLELDYPRWELIVVDQTPIHEPKTADYLHELEQAGKIRYFKLEKPNLPGARNYGCLQARGEIVLYVDDDIIPSSRLIQAHACAYQNREVGSVAGRITLPNMDETALPTRPVGVFTYRGGAVRNYESLVPQEVDFAPGGNMSFRRDLLIRAGGFSPYFIGNALGEETDLGLRFKRILHKKIVFVPEAHLVHLAVKGGGSENRTNRYNHRYFFHAHHNFTLITFKHFQIHQFVGNLLFRAATLGWKKCDAMLPVLFILATLRAICLSSWLYTLTARRFRRQRI